MIADCMMMIKPSSRICDSGDFIVIVTSHSKAEFCSKQQAKLPKPQRCLGALGQNVSRRRTLNHQFLVSSEALMSSPVAFLIARAIVGANRLCSSCSFPTGVCRRPPHRTEEAPHFANKVNESV
jgi:hypothetical protein